LRLVRRGRWEYAERTHAQGMAVIIVAVTPGDCILFVEQPRAALGKRTIELPAGLVGDTHAGDTFEDAARRELVEETGWQPAQVEVLVVGPTTAGMSNERAAFVRASGLMRVGAGGGDESEDIVVHEVPLGDAPRWLMAQYRAGLEVDLKAWAGLWLATHDIDNGSRS
jgi:ADP-ribose pyrophosphatase